MKNYFLTAIIVALAATLSACSEQTVDQPGSRSTLTATQQHLWSNSCALCHVTGAAGAPRFADNNDWKSRKAKGKKILLQHTLEGFNNMPPLGYCMACETDDFAALIEFMAGDSAWGN